MAQPQTLIRAAVAATLLALLLAACGGDPEGAPAATPAGATPAAEAPAPAEAEAPAEAAPALPPPLPAGDYRIVAVAVGKALDRDNNVASPVEVFAARDTLHAAVTGVGASQGLTLSAQWRTADGTPVARSEQVLVPTSPTITTFSVQNPDGWPAGRYQVEIAINGRVEQTREFEVR